MTELLTAFSTGVIAFVATNIDDIFILTLLFSQVNQIFRRHHIILGQYLGFCIIILISFLGILGHYLIPSEWIRLLGLLPVILGLVQLIRAEENSVDTAEILEENNFKEPSVSKSFYYSLLSPQTYGVATITLANGSDNIGIYLPLFANTKPIHLPIIISTFLLLVGVWCAVAYQITQLPAIAPLIKDYGSELMPCVLIGLGVFIIKENLIATFLALGCSYLWVLFWSDRNLSKVK
jgi:cadmium resistance transport/sequestration family protein